MRRYPPFSLGVRYIDWELDDPQANPSIKYWTSRNTFTFTVENTGNVTLIEVTITDPKVTVTGGQIPTLLFSDVENSTQMRESIGDSEWAAQITRHLEELRTTVVDHGGTVVKTLGDGAMAAIGSAADALNAAIDIQRFTAEAPFNICVGLHTGDAVDADSDYIAITVNKAARIASAAEPGEILLSSVTTEMASGRNFGLGSSRTVDLKGLAETHQVTQLTSPPTGNHLNSKHICVPAYGNTLNRIWAVWMQCSVSRSFFA